MESTYYNISYCNKVATKHKLLRETKTKLFLKEKGSDFILRVSKRTLKTRFFAKGYSFESAKILDYSKI